VLASVAAGYVDHRGAAAVAVAFQPVRQWAGRLANRVVYGRRASYIGEPAGGQGVKLEQQVLLTADGPELLSTFPFEEVLTS
jgi:hypothetical protein